MVFSCRLLDCKAVFFVVNSFPSSFDGAELFERVEHESLLLEFSLLESEFGSNCFSLSDDLDSDEQDP